MKEGCVASPRALAHTGIVFQVNQFYHAPAKLMFNAARAVGDTKSGSAALEEACERHYNYLDDLNSLED